MVILKEQPLKERGTEYARASPKELWNCIAGFIANRREFQVHLASLSVGVTYMEGRYNKVKVAGQQISFLDTRTPFSRFVVYLRDIADGEIGTDQDVDFTTVTLYLKNKMMISITPFL